MNDSKLKADTWRTEGHQEDKLLPRSLQIVAGLLLGGFTLLCLAGSVTLVISPSAQAPVLAPTIGVGMVLVCCWLLMKCGRLIIGRKVAGGLMGPRALRLLAWFFLLLPVGGIFTGYFITHTLAAIVQTAAYISAFFGVRSLARFREFQVLGIDASLDERQ